MPVCMAAEQVRGAQDFGRVAAVAVLADKTVLCHRKGREGRQVVHALNIHIENACPVEQGKPVAVALCSYAVQIRQGIVMSLRNRSPAHRINQSRVCTERLMWSAYAVLRGG